MSSLKTIDGPMMTVRLGCRTCRRYHDGRLRADDPTRLIRELDGWQHKHAGHALELPVILPLDIPRDLRPLDEPDMPASPPWWHPDGGYRENTNFQTTYVASAALTFTSVNSLATSAGLTAGASSLVVDQGASAAALVQSIGGFVKLGTSPTAATVEAWAYCAYDDTPTYPDTIAGTDATKTLTTTAIKQAGLAPIGSIATPATSAQVQPFNPVSVAGLFGGFLPRYWGVFVVHNTAVNLAASGNTWTQKGLYVAA
jgi:hypothetical protein